MILGDIFLLFMITTVSYAHHCKQVDLLYQPLWAKMWKQSRIVTAFRNPEVRARA